MEVTNSLLVAMMFITVLTVSVGNILMTLAALVQRREKYPLDWIPLSWIFLILLEHFLLFWYTLEILSVEQWDFAGFLYVIAGPILLFLATSVLVADMSEPASGNARSDYFHKARRVFSILALLMIWLIGVDFILVGRLTAVDAGNAVLLVLFLLLALLRKPWVHVAATVVAWALFLLLVTLQETGVVG